MVVNYDDYSEGYKKGYADAKKEFKAPCGTWTPRLHASENDIFVCSNCSKELGYNPPFCPNCGAKMNNAWVIN